MASKRAQSIDASGIRRIFDLAANLKDPIDLSIGQPDFDATPELKAAAHAAIDAGKSRYTPTQGIPELRNKIKARYGVQNNPEIELFLTLGVSGGVTLSYMALLDPGDEVLVPDPFFGQYRDVAKLLNAVPKFYDVHPDFSLKLDKIQAQITPKTRAILINTPSNPTGYAFSAADMNGVVELAKKHDLWIISDEIYDAFAYDAPHQTCFGKYEKTILLGGFSKSHGIPGWRCGYAMGPKAIIGEMMKCQQYTFVCVPSITQFALAAGYDSDIAPIVAAYKEKRDFIYNGLKDHYEVNKPGGAFYIYPMLPAGLSGQQFVEKCIANNLLLVPGNVFSNRDTHFRISFAAPMERLQKGIDVLKTLAKG